MAKRYLDVSYGDRELAKRLGAKWDPSVRRWYCPNGSPLAKIFKWRAEAKMSEAASELVSGAKMSDMKSSKSAMPKTPPASPPASFAVNENFELFMAS